MSSDSSLSAIEAGAISLAGLVVTALVAFVPSWAPEKELLTTIMGSAVSFGFMIAAAIHAHGAQIAKAATAVASPATLPKPAPAPVVAAVPDPHPLTGIRPPQNVSPPPTQPNT